MKEIRIGEYIFKVKKWTFREKYESLDLLTKIDNSKYREKAETIAKFLKMIVVDVTKNGDKINVSEDVFLDMSPDIVEKLFLESLSFLLNLSMKELLRKNTSFQLGINQPV